MSVYDRAVCAPVCACARLPPSLSLSFSLSLALSCLLPSLSASPAVIGTWHIGCRGKKIPSILWFFFNYYRVQWYFLRSRFCVKIYMIRYSWNIFIWNNSNNKHFFIIEISAWHFVRQIEFVINMWNVFHVIYRRCFVYKIQIPSKFVVKRNW